LLKHLYRWRCELNGIPLGRHDLRNETMKQQ
jgi:hypothetical protein